MIPTRMSLILICGLLLSLTACQSTNKPRTTSNSATPAATAEANTTGEGKTCGLEESTSLEATTDVHAVDVSGATESSATLTNEPSAVATAVVKPNTTLKDVKHLATKSRTSYKITTLTFDKPISLYVNNVELKAKSQVSFYDDTGALSSVYSFSNTAKFKRAGQILPFYRWISFSRKGEVTFGYIAKAVTFAIGKNTVTYARTQPDGYMAKVFFYASGNISSIHIAVPHDITVGGKTYKFDHHSGCGADLDFYENGNFKGGYLAADTTIEGVAFKKGKKVTFSATGTLTTKKP
ncbi:hypothetical protein KKF84_15105 [Myxococcota bacterium]|nr:hypothetical protein [Myxococcota bacterium]